MWGLGPVHVSAIFPFHADSQSNRKLLEFHKVAPKDASTLHTSRWNLLERIFIEYDRLPAFAHRNVLRVSPDGPPPPSLSVPHPFPLGPPPPPLSVPHLLPSPPSPKKTLCSASQPYTLYSNRPAPLFTMILQKKKRKNLFYENIQIRFMSRPSAIPTPPSPRFPQPAQHQRVVQTILLDSVREPIRQSNQYGV